MSFHSDYLKDTGLLSAYQTFLKQLMNNQPKKENALEEASKFFTNYEKKYKPSTSIKATLILPEATYQKKERKKITLETKSRIFPSAPVITPKIFERQERSRPLIGKYKAEPLQYEFNDIFDRNEIKLDENVNAAEFKDLKDSTEEQNRGMGRNEVESSEKLSRKSSKESKLSRSSARSKQSDMSKVSKKSAKSIKSKKSEESDESSKKNKKKNSGSDSGKSGSSKS